MFWCERLFNPEISFDVRPNGHRLAVRVNGWREPPVLYGLDRVFVQAVTQRTFDLDIRGMTFRCDDQVENDNSGYLGGPGLVGIRRIGTCEALRVANAAATCQVSAVYEHRGLGGF